MRMVYSPLDALRIARENPDREVVFFAVGFETTAPSTALTLMRAKAEGIRNFFGLLQPRHDRAAAARAARVARPAARRLHRAGPRLDRRRRAAVRVHPGRLRQAGRDLRASSRSTSLQSRPHGAAPARATAAARSRTSTRASSRTTGTRQALQVLEEVFELRPHFEWRGLGFISHSALKLVRGVRATSTPSSATRCRACASPTRRRASAARC